MATWQNKEDLHCYGEGFVIGEERYSGVSQAGDGKAKAWF